MSDRLNGNSQIVHLRRTAEEILSREDAPEDVTSRLWELIEQVEAEREELERTRDENDGLHRQFADLYEHAPVGYLLLNSQLIVMQANATARRFFADTPILTGVSSLGGAIDRDSQETYYQAIHRCRRDGTVATAEIRPVGESGTPWLQARVSCDRDEDGAIRFFRVVLSDISERVAAQQRAEERRLEVQRLLEEKEILLREINHRVKNDFNLMGAFLSLQAHRADHPDIAEALGDARERTMVMGQMYQLLHDHQQYAAVDLKRLGEDITRNFLAATAGITVEVNRDLAPVEVKTKTGLSVGIILNEILTNIRKYAVQPATALVISMTLRSVSDGEFELEVTDNGPGFPQAVLSGDERGFGFEVIQSLVEQSEGTLVLQNHDPGPGAIVRIRLKHQ